MQKTTKYDPVKLRMCKDLCKGIYGAPEARENCIVMCMEERKIL